VAACDGSISRIRRDGSNDRDVIEGNLRTAALKVPFVAIADIESCGHNVP
jgi:hypothetical protein